MRYLVILLVLSVAVPTISAESPPLAERYLHSGELIKGQQELERALAASPKDDQLRFSLGVVQFVRGVERLAQSFYTYGLKSEHENAPFLRIPVPQNPEPAVIRYEDLRRILDDFRRDLMDAEEVLAGVTDDRVVLPLKLAEVRMDLNGDGKADDRFVDIMTKIMRGQRFDFLKENPPFLVRFDRGDVAWLRAYCHLLAGMVDFLLAFDTKEGFTSWADTTFAKPKDTFVGTEEERVKKSVESSRGLRIAEPVRLSRFRTHLLKVAELNRETWRYIRSETDNSYEWLPNSKQQSVLRMPVRDNMIDAWLAAMGELEALLEGKKLMFIIESFGKQDGRGINMKRLFEDPPPELNLDTIATDGPGEKYMEKGQFINVGVIFNVISVFGNPTSIGYAAWFN